MMTKRHFEELAAINLAMVDDMSGTAFMRQTHANMVKAQARMFAAENPRFDRSRYLTASGVE